jgi:multidrug efflux pump subunit AcrA (membrane-fusion protein)
MHFLSPPAPNQEAAPQAVRVTVVWPTIQPVSHTLKAVGSFLTENEVTISAEVDGWVTQRLVDEGSPLEPGQIALRLDQERRRLKRSSELVPADSVPFS